MNYVTLFNLESLHSESSAPLLIMSLVSFLNQLSYEEENWRVWSPADERTDAEQIWELYHTWWTVLLFSQWSLSYSLPLKYAEAEKPLRHTDK